MRYRAPNGANYNPHPPFNGQILKKKTLLRKEEKKHKNTKNTETVEPTT